MERPSTARARRAPRGRLLLPWAILLVAATALGLTTNAVRDAGHLELHRAWFASPTPPADSGTESGDTRGSTGGDPARDAAPPPTPRPHRGHQFTDLSLAGMRALVDDALEHPGRVLILDAREEAHYRAGHLPGAVHVPYFGLPRSVTELLPILGGVRWIVVYCESPTCDDGIQLCRALYTEFGVDRDRIALFDGGVEAWRAAGLPLVTGPRPVEPWR